MLYIFYFIENNDDYLETELYIFILTLKQAIFSKNFIAQFSIV